MGGTAPPPGKNGGDSPRRYVLSLHQRLGTDIPRGRSWTRAGLAVCPPHLSPGACTFPTKEILPRSDAVTTPT